jgi:hypothetical protein
MFSFLSAYSISDLREAVARGNVLKTRICLDYFQSKGKLDEVLHDRGDLGRKLPEGAWDSFPVLEAFQDIHKPRYLTAALLLEAGTDIYRYDRWGGNIFFFAMKRMDLPLFRLLLWYADYEKALQISGFLRDTTVASGLEDWETLCTGVKDKIKATATEIEKCRNFLDEAKKAQEPEKVVYFSSQAAEIYIKQADYDKTPDLKKHYLEKALAVYQELYERFPGVFPSQRQVDISFELSRIAKARGDVEESLIYNAYAGMINIQKEHPMAQAAFAKAFASSNKSVNLQLKQFAMP